MSWLENEYYDCSICDAEVTSVHALKYKKEVPHEWLDAYPYDESGNPKPKIKDVLI